MSEKVLTAYRDWQLNEVDDFHADDAMMTFDTGIDNDITLDAEGENGIYEAYIERLEARIKKHRQQYEEHLSGRVKSDQFIRDIEITKRLMEDFMVYQDRFIKLASSAKKKASNGR
jgi:hypothetical protein